MGDSTTAIAEIQLRDLVITDLRDAIRLMIGREMNTPWYEVPQRHVDGYVSAIRELKEMKRTRENDAGKTLAGGGVSREDDWPCNLGLQVRT